MEREDKESIWYDKPLDLEETYLEEVSEFENRPFQDELQKPYDS